MDDAVKEFQEALRAKPDYAEARLALADALRQSGHLEDAIGNYRDYLRLRPQDAVTRVNLANSLLRTRNFDAAIQETSKPSSPSPVSPSPITTSPSPSKPPARRLAPGRSMKLNRFSPLRRQMQGRPERPRHLPPLQVENALGRPHERRRGRTGHFVAGIQRVLQP